MISRTILNVKRPSNNKAKKHKKAKINREFVQKKAQLREKIINSVIAGLYANIADAQRFADYVAPKGTPLAEAFAAIAIVQADAVEKAI